MSGLALMRLHAWSSTAMWTSAAVTIPALVMLTGSGMGQGEWDTAVLDATNAGLFFVFASACGAAMDAWRFRRSHPLPSRSGREVLAIVLRVVSGAVWGWVGMALLVLVAMGAAFAVSDFRMPNLALLAVPFAWVFLGAALGFNIGARTPPWVAQPALIVGVWFVSGAAALPEEVWPNMISGLNNGVFIAGVVMPNGYTLVLQAVLFVALGCLLLGLTASGVRSRPGVPLASAAALVLVTAGLSVVGVARTTTDIRPAEGVCRDSDGLTICTWPDHRQGASAAADYGPRMVAALTAAGLNAPQVVAEPGIAAAPGAMVAQMRWVDDGQMFAEAALTFARCGPGKWTLSPNDVRVYDMAEWLRLRGATVPDALVPDRIAELRKQHDAQQYAWLRQELEALQCVPA